MTKPLSDADYNAKVRARLRASSVVSAAGCWEWTGFTNHKGYGSTNYRSRTNTAHRISWWAHRGPTPKGAHVCHTCDNPKCINPDHLYIGTPTQNERDKVARGRHHHTRKTHCKYGHEFTPDNTLIVYGKHGKPWRHCKACSRISQRIRAGWTSEQAKSLPVTPHGHRPVNGSFRRAD